MRSAAAASGVTGLPQCVCLCLCVVCSRSRCSLFQPLFLFGFGLRLWRRAYARGLSQAVVVQFLRKSVVSSLSDRVALHEPRSGASTAGGRGVRCAVCGALLSAQCSHFHSSPSRLTLTPLLTEHWLRHTRHAERKSNSKALATRTTPDKRPPAQIPPEMGWDIARFASPSSHSISMRTRRLNLKLPSATENRAAIDVSSARRSARRGPRRAGACSAGRSPRRSRGTEGARAGPGEEECGRDPRRARGAVGARAGPEAEGGTRLRRGCAGGQGAPTRGQHLRTPARSHPWRSSWPRTARPNPVGLPEASCVSCGRDWWATTPPASPPTTTRWATGTARSRRAPTSCGSRT